MVWRIMKMAAIACFAVGCGAGQGASDGAQGPAADSHGGPGHDHPAAPDAASVVSADAIESPAEPVVCDLGTVYPDLPLIDPDNPDYHDADVTFEQVVETFAKDKAKDGPAYRAYKAALAHQDVLECAFCACGCEPSLGHLSAIDCFKDMHGFG